jgi:class 3 adenylate cyclase/predicted ATPase
MSDIRQWLDELSLGQYGDEFEENDIDRRALLELSDQDLKDIGVSSLGHRRVIIGAIKELSSSVKIAAALADAPTSSPPPTAPVREAERRQITVMFCDLVGSTALSEALDPEELRGVMQAYRKACSKVIARYDGHVAQYLGDGVMVYFGWPAAHEDDAGRAVRAGLDIIDAVAALESEAALAVRIGIATGLVVVGESDADDGADSKLAVGETPNIAARIQGLAAPGTVAIAQSTRRLMGGAFALEDLGTHDAKGVAGGLQVHRVLGAAVTESRFEASQSGALTPIVGRETEMAMLLDRWQRATDGEGQVVLLSGEAGIGKSRVTDALRAHVANKLHVRLRYHCSPYHTSSPLYPVIAQLERASGFARDDDEEAKLDKLDRLLGKADAETALIAGLLSLSVERYPPLDLSPQQKKTQTIGVLAAQVRRLAWDQPVLMIFEDVHWADPTSLETIGAVIESIDDIPCLLVVTFRPEFKPPWSDQGHATALTLNRLGRKQSTAMVAKVTGGKALPEPVLDEIVAKTDGIPLFVEELTKTVLEAGILVERANGYELDGPLPPLAIPATLQDSLMARLDKLNSVKEVAQIAACIGREFSNDFLAAASPLKTSDLEQALQKLVNSELIFCRGTPPELTYVFKHALVRDAAYESLLKSDRRALHKSLADILESKFPLLVEQQPELLAQHEESAGLIEPAISHWRQAGIRAAARSANSEAVQQLDRALDLTSRLADTEVAMRTELEVRSEITTPLIAVAGHASIAVEQNSAHALNLCDRIDDTDRLYPALYGLWVSHHARGEQAAARPIAERLLEAGRSTEDRIALVMGHRMTGVVDTIVGKYVSAKKNLNSAVALYDRKADGNLAYLYGQDPGVAALGYLAKVYALTGEVDFSRSAAEQAFMLADQVGHDFTKAYALFWAGLLANIIISDFDRLKKYAKQQVDLCRSHEFYMWGEIATYYSAYVDFKHLDEESKVGKSVNCFDYLQEYWDQGTRLLRPHFLTLTAETMAEGGDTSAALDMLEEAVRLTEEMTEAWSEADVLRVRGDIKQLHLGDVVGAEADLFRSIKVARAQGALTWELRGTVSLARLWRSQGKDHEALSLLAPVYDGFKEGSDLADLRAAKVLLKELNEAL